MRLEASGRLHLPRVSLKNGDRIVCMWADCSDTVSLQKRTTTRTSADHQPKPLRKWLVTMRDALRTANWPLGVDASAFC